MQIEGRSKAATASTTPWLKGKTARAAHASAANYRLQNNVRTQLAMISFTCMRWWEPKSRGVFLLSCEADVRVGGRYRFEFGHESSKPMAFFGRYIEVTPHSRLVWTNYESDDGAVTTVTF